MESCVTPNNVRRQAARVESKAVYASEVAPFEALVAKVEEIDIYSHQACHQFPKYEKHILAAEIRNCINAIVKLMVTAFKRKQKSAALFDLDVQVAFLKHLVRKSYSLTYINAHKFKVWTGHVIELGKMVGGWLKHDSKLQKG
jgi:hypothetical protein